MSTNHPIKHKHITRRRRAIFKSTGKRRIDWARLAERFPMFREEIHRKRYDQAALARIQTEGLVLIGKVA